MNSNREELRKVLDRITQETLAKAWSGPTMEPRDRITQETLSKAWRGTTMEPLDRITQETLSKAWRGTTMEPLEKKEETKFNKLKNKLAKKPGVADPAALAAHIGREKYGAHKFAKKAAAGRKD